MQSNLAHLFQNKAISPGVKAPLNLRIIALTSVTYVLNLPFVHGGLRVTVTQHVYQPLKQTLKTAVPSLLIVLCQQDAAQPPYTVILRIIIREFKMISDCRGVFIIFSFAQGHISGFFKRHILFYILKYKGHFMFVCFFFVKEDAWLSLNPELALCLHTSEPPNSAPLYAHAVKFFWSCSCACLPIGVCSWCAIYLKNVSTPGVKYNDSVLK